MWAIPRDLPDMTVAADGGKTECRFDLDIIRHSCDTGTNDHAAFRREKAYSSHAVDRDRRGFEAANKVLQAADNRDSLHCRSWMDAPIIQSPTDSGRRPRFIVETTVRPCCLGAVHCDDLGTLRCVGGLDSRSNSSPS